jgi:hypothetical protein
VNEVHCNPEPSWVCVVSGHRAYGEHRFHFFSGCGGSFKTVRTHCPNCIVKEES